MCKMKHILCFLFFVLSVILSENVIAYGGSFKGAVENPDPAILEHENERQQYRIYKDQQSKLSDNERSKYLLQNEYWLVNKNEKLWLGLFKGKYIYSAPSKYRPGLSAGRYIQEKILRIKIDKKILQFRLYAGDDAYPSDCDTYRGVVYKDTKNYTAFLTSCGYKENNQDDAENLFHVYIFIYDKSTSSLFKIFSSLMSINRSYSEIANLFNIIESDGVYIYPDPANYVGRKCAFEVKDNKNVFPLNPQTLKPWADKLIEKAKSCRSECKDEPDECPDDCSFNHCSPLILPVVVEQLPTIVTQ